MLSWPGTNTVRARPANAPGRLNSTNRGMWSRPDFRASTVLSVTYCGYWYWVKTCSDAPVANSCPGVAAGCAACCRRQVESISAMLRS